MLRNSIQVFCNSSLRSVPHKSLMLKPKTFFFKIQKPAVFSSFKATNFSRRRFFSSFFDRKLNSLRYPLYYYLIGANLLVFFAWNTGVISKKFLFDHFTLSKYTIGKHNYHTLITHAFSHINTFHMGINMLTLYFFGKFVEFSFGSRVLLQLYLLGALIGGLFITSQNNQKRHVVSHLGASGATTAILSFFIMNFPKHTIFLFILPVPAWVVGGLIFFQSIYNYNSEMGISYSGHMGGFIAGIGMFFHLRGRLF